MNINRLVFKLICIFLLFGETAWPAPNLLPSQAAEEKTPAPATNEENEDYTIPTVKERIKALENQNKMLKIADAKATSEQLGVEVKDLQERSRIYDLLISAYEKLLLELNKKTDQTKERERILENLNAQKQRGMLVKPPYSLSFYDNLIGEFNLVQQKKETLEIAITTAKSTIEDIQARLKETEKAWRSAKDSVGQAKDKEAEQKIGWKVEMLKLNKELNEVQEKNARTELDNLKNENAIETLKGQLLDQQISWVRKNLRFDPADLSEKLAELNKQESLLNGKTAQLTKEKNEAQKNLQKLQLKLREAVYQEDIIRMETELKAKEIWYETYRIALDQLEEMLHLILHQKQVVQMRYDLVKGNVTKEQRHDWMKMAEDHFERMGRLISVEQAEQNNLTQQINTLESQLSQEQKTPELVSSIGKQLKGLRKRSELGLEFVATILTTRQLDRRLLTELKLNTQEEPISVKVEEVAIKLRRLWDYEVWVIDDRPVTVRKLTVAVVILIIGLMIVRFILAIIARRLHAHKSIKETTASNIHKLLSYFAYFLVLLFVMRIVNIPLAAFAFLGGAIAIGIGFGAQNLINNFISGFIIMGEQPINIGDLIELEGVIGKVEDIGARCTRIRTGENIHILVPNSSFLEKNITNWTLTDNRIRTSISVGVAYGSPVDEVEKQLSQAAEKVDKVLKYPAPFVLFSDFGDNALVFNLFFWVSIYQIIERRMIESRVRFKVDELFRDAGLVIAFPQRDIHLDTQTPLEMKIIQAPEQK